MAWTKYNNPNRKRKHKKISRTDADIIAAKNLFDDRCRGIEMPLSFYDEQSDKMCGKPSRKIYN